MPLHSLQDLAAQLCAAMGVATPTLLPGRDGTLAFSTTIRGVDITVSHDAFADLAHAVVHVFFGVPQADRELEALRDVLNANVERRETRGPFFGRDRDTGRIVLKYPYPLAECSGERLLPVLQALVDLALEWREEFVSKCKAAPPTCAQLA